MSGGDGEPQCVAGSNPASPTITGRPRGANPDEWHLFLAQFLDSRANHPNGLTLVAFEITEALQDANRRGFTEGKEWARQTMRV